MLHTVTYAGPTFAAGREVHQRALLPFLARLGLFSPYSAPKLSRETESLVQLESRDLHAPMLPLRVVPSVRSRDMFSVTVEPTP